MARALPSFIVVSTVSDQCAGTPTKVLSSGRHLAHLAHRCPGHQVCIAMESALARLADLPCCHLAEVVPAFVRVYLPARLGFGTGRSLEKTSWLIVDLGDRECLECSGW